MEEKSVYLHVPFCRKKCPYCHFYVTKTKEESIALFLKAMHAEVESQRTWFDRPMRSIYLGGGTPSQIGPESLSELIEALPRNDQTEVTVEINPEDATDEFFKKLRGVNRVSFGVQSLSDPQLVTLGRAHTSSQSVRAVEMAHKAGVEHITIDLMYELPHQTLESWAATLDALEGLPINHISLYNLVIEENTAYYRKRESLQKVIPSDEMGLKMLEMAVDRFEALGLKRYEISAFGRPSVHNVGYWKYRDTLGLGPSAFSYAEGKRWQNHSNLRKWAENVLNGLSPVGFEERLKPAHAERERVAVGLRMVEGIKLRGISPPLVGDLQALDNQGLVSIASEAVTLTDRGLLFYDQIAAQII